eukprot:jgi/Bigna1/86137/estExt_fgenesh1_pg.C_80167
MESRNLVRWLGVIVGFISLITATNPVQSSPYKSNTNALDGIFLSLDSSNAMFGVQEWKNEFQAMKDVGMTFFAVRSVFNGVRNVTGCPFGSYDVFYNTTLQPTHCYNQRGIDNDRGSLGYLLQAANEVGLKIHLGMSMPSSDFRGGAHFTNKSEYFDMFNRLQIGIALEIWEKFEDSTSSIVGIYTGLEENNLPGWVNNKDDLVKFYFEPFSSAIKEKLRSDVTVWSSPYAVLNTELHGFQHFVSAEEYASFWGDVFTNAPGFDFIANQDSMGWQGNSLQNVSDLMKAISAASTAAGRQTWSNVELFEGWPQPCIYPKKCGRAPAPFERIKSQIETESRYASILIAWEWHSCLSPYSNNLTATLYRQYSDYVRNL